MNVPSAAHDDLEAQTGPYASRIALTEDPDIAPLAIVLFKDFDLCGVPRACQTIFLAPATVEAIGSAIAELNQQKAPPIQTAPPEAAPAAE